MEKEENSGFGYFFDLTDKVTNIINYYYSPELYNSDKEKVNRVVGLVLKGYSDDMIANELGIARSTALTYIYPNYRKKARERYRQLKMLKGGSYFSRFFARMDRIQEAVTIASSPRFRIHNKARSDKILQLLNTDKSNKEICEELNISRSTFYHYTSLNHRLQNRKYAKQNREHFGQKGTIRRETISGLDVWTAEEISDRLALTTEELNERGLLGDPETKLKTWIDLGMIEVLNVSDEIYYRPNPECPYTIVMDGLWKD